MPFWKKQNQRTNKKNSPFEKNNYGYNGLIIIFNKLDIDLFNWIQEETKRERGGMKFTLPNAEGEFYLGWNDFYNIDIKFINTGKKFKSEISLGDFEYMLKEIEAQRDRHVKQIASLLMKTFPSKNTSDNPGKPF